MSQIEVKNSPEHDVVFTGGFPGESVEQILRTMSEGVGARALAYPDGEQGVRSGWVTNLSHSTWPHVDGVEEIPSPLPEDHPYRIMKSFGIRDGVTELRLEGLLPYSRATIESYQVFKRLRDEGVIDRSVRFQMALPTAYTAVCFYFPDRDHRELAARAWTSALQDEYRRMLEVIPAEDLVIQLDYVGELAQIAGMPPELSFWLLDMSPEEAFRMLTAESYLAPQVTTLPESVKLGYHLCLGTYPTQPVVQVPDIGLAVDLANALAANSGRRVDYVHLPAIREADESYFAPLERLDVGSTDVYLGLECNDGLDAMKRRITDAERFHQGFGVAHYCGYVWNADILPQLLSDLVAGADYHGSDVHAGRNSQ
jgi:hypothetical protein